MSKTGSRQFWQLSGYILWSLVGLLVLGFAWYGVTRYVQTLRPAAQAQPGEVAGEATAPEVAAPAPSPIPEAPTAAPEETMDVTAEDSSDTNAVNSADPVSWTLVNVAKYFETVQVDGLVWERPNGTHFATDLSNRRYEAVEVDPNKVGGSFSWCGPGQYDCPPWLGLYRVRVTDGVSAQMDIATRVMVEADEDGLVNFRWRFNDLLREGTDKSLLDDYNTAASGGQLGLFVAVADPMMDPATLTYLGKEFTVGYGCWDCLAHTQGEDAAIVSLDDESIGHFGPDTVTLGDSLYPAYVIPVPSPKDEPDFMVDLIVKIPEGTQVVFWFGRYDPLDPPG